jgi:hypothetical protein
MPLSDEGAYLFNVCLHSKWSGKWLEAVFALGDVTELRQELVVWLSMHDEVLHQQDIVRVLPITDTALQWNICERTEAIHSTVIHDTNSLSKRHSQTKDHLAMTANSWKLKKCIHKIIKTHLVSIYVIKCYNDTGHNAKAYAILLTC